MSDPINAYVVLKAARRLISHPDRWCTVNAAQDKNGEPVGSIDPTAVRWCAVGAVSQCSGNHKYADSFGLCMTYLREGSRGIAPELIYRLPSYVNDHLGHAKTMLMYDKAIEYARRDVEDD